MLCAHANKTIAEIATEARHSCPNLGFSSDVFPSVDDRLVSITSAAMKIGRFLIEYIDISTHR